MWRGFCGGNKAGDHGRVGDNAYTHYRAAERGEGVTD